MAKNTYVGQLIRYSLGKFEDVDLKQGNIEWGEYMHVRVTVDITKPIARRKKLTIDNLEYF